jgi:hypothetical protein
MESNVNNFILLKLDKEKSSLDQRLADLEKQLLVDNLTTQNEIEGLLIRQENLEKTFNYINQIQQIQDVTDNNNRILELKKEEKHKLAKYNTYKKGRLEGLIIDHKAGASRYKGTTMHDSYLESVNYYQSQLSSLLSSLES